VVVAPSRRLADVVVVVRVAWHGRSGHGAELVGVVVVVGVHGAQVGVHPTEVGAGGSRVALAIARRLVVGHGVGGGSRSPHHRALHAGGVGRRWAWLRERGPAHAGGGGDVAGGDGRAPDGGDGADGGGGGAAEEHRRPSVVGSGGRGGGGGGGEGAGAGDRGRGELSTAL